MKATLPLEPGTERWLAALARNGARPQAVYLARRVIERARAQFPALPPAGFGLSMGPGVALHFERGRRWLSLACQADPEAKRLALYRHGRVPRPELQLAGTVAKLADLDRYLQRLSDFL